MYTKDKLHRITLRLNEEQFNYVAESSSFLDVSPSDFLRMVINSSMVIAKNYDKNKSQEGTGRENDNANIDDKL